jgi:hypothetical protein
MHRVAVRALFAMLLSTVVACQESAMDLPSRFVLTTLNGDALPAVESEVDGSRYVIVADTMLFSAGGQGLRVRHVLVTLPGQPEKSERQSTVFSYRVTRNFIEISYLCPPNAATVDCAPGPHMRGGASPTELTLLERFRPVSLRYVRG